MFVDRQDAYRGAGTRPVLQWLIETMEKTQ
jgi:hypothetical protein